jgi:hypothetical protein
VPVTAFYPRRTLAAMLGWQRLARRELELVELPAHSRPGDQRLLSILNATLGFSVRLTPPLFTPVITAPEPGPSQTMAVPSI